MRSMNASRMALTLLLLAVAARPSANAGTLDLSATPPELTPAVAPNIILTYDDSNSMRKAFVPGYLGDGEAAYGAYSGFITDPISGGRICGWYSADAAKVVHPWNFSPVVNTLYYDEQQTYVAPKKPDGSPMDPGSFTAAWEDGIAANTGGSRATRNLLASYAIYGWGGNTVQPETIHPASTSHPASMQCMVADGYMPFPFADADGDHAHAFFYRFMGDRGSRRDLFDPSKYIAVDVATLGEAQKSNFTIWYGFYRTRNQAARSALARALEGIPRTIRMQWQRLSDGLLDNKAIIRPLTDEAQFQKLMNFVYASQPFSGTPTRSAMTRVAGYFGPANAGMSETNPYYDVASGKELSCRRNYSLLVTDGGWNRDDGFTHGWSDTTTTAGRMAVGANPDQTATTLPDGRKYDPDSASTIIYGGGPSQRGLSGFADVAFHYWATDLRPDLGNEVVPYVPDRTTGITGTAISTPIGSDPRTLPDEIYFNPANDPATWQHLVQFVVTFGLGGILDFPGDLTALRKGAKTWSDWASPPNDELLDTPAKSDDTWHAAINSRGQLFNANNPQQLIDQIRRVIHSIVARNGASTAGAVSNTVLGNDTSYFRTGFSSDDWSGVVQSVTVDESGNLGCPVGAPAICWMHAPGMRTTASFSPAPRRAVAMEWPSKAPRCSMPCTRSIPASRQALQAMTDWSGFVAIGPRRAPCSASAARCLAPWSMPRRCMCRIRPVATATRFPRGPAIQGRGRPKWRLGTMVACCTAMSSSWPIISSVHRRCTWAPTTACCMPSMRRQRVSIQCRWMLHRREPNAGPTCPTPSTEGCAA